MSVSGTAALGDVMTVLSTSFNAAGVCVGLAEWAGHAVVAVGAAPVLGRAEPLAYAQPPLVKSFGTAKINARGAPVRGGVELTLAPVGNALEIYGAMCESREQQARPVHASKLDGLLQVVSDQHRHWLRVAASSAANVVAPHDCGTSTDAV